MSSKYVNNELRKELSGWKQYDSAQDQDKSEALLNLAEAKTEEFQPRRSKTSNLEQLSKLMQNSQNVDNFIGEALNSEWDSLRFAHGVDKINPVEREMQTSHFIFSSKLEREDESGKTIDTLNPNQ